SHSVDSDASPHTDAAHLEVAPTPLQLACKHNRGTNKNWNIWMCPQHVATVSPPTDFASHAARRRQSCVFGSIASRTQLSSGINRPATTFVPPHARPVIR